MSYKQIIVVALLIAAAGWISFVIDSLWGISNALPDVAVPEPLSSATGAAAVAADSERPLMESISVRTAVTNDIASAAEAGEGKKDTARSRSAERKAPLDVECDPGLVGLEMRCACNWRNGGSFISEDEIRIGGHFRLLEMSDDELRAFADSGDYGYAQFLYAYDRLLGLSEGLPSRRKQEMALDRAAARAAAGNDELFETAKQYLVEAIRNQNWDAAGWLSSIYYRIDRVEARAWLLIEQEAGGSGLERREMREGMGVVPDPYTDFEREQSEIRAAQITDEYSLAPHFHPPEICLIPR